jgi:hypothetical protein
MSHRLLCAFAFTLATLLGGCGGGEEAAPASPQAKAPLAQQAPIVFPVVPTADGVMDWIEQNYANHFPSHQASLPYLNLVYRYYSATGNYLAVVGEDIYVVGPVTGGAPLFVGTLTQASCIVYPQNCVPAVSGTMASGAAAIGATVTIVDSTNTSVTTTTGAGGVFSASTAGMTGPFLIRGHAISGQMMFGFTADARTHTVANITPISDLMARTWYAAQGASVETAFASPGTYAPPSPAQVGVLGETFLSIVGRAATVHDAGLAAPQDLITKPFVTDGTGFDKLLDNMTVSLEATPTLILTTPGVTQTTTFTVDGGTATVTANTTTSDGVSTSSSSLVNVLPVQAAQLTALQEINVSLAAFAGTVNTQGAALTAAHLVGYCDPDLLDAGFDRDQFLAGFVPDLAQPGTLSLSVQQLLELDLPGGTARILMRFHVVRDGVARTELVDMAMRKIGNAWLLSGDRRLAAVDVDAEARLNQGSYTDASGPVVNLDVRPPQDTVVSVTASSSFGTPTLTQSATELYAPGIFRDAFYALIGPLAPPLPQAGTNVSVTLTRAVGGTATYTIALRSFTTEQVAIAGPLGSTMAHANLGGSVNVSWTLPVTYLVQRVQLSGQVFTGNPANPETFQCHTGEQHLATTATSGVVSLPTTCNGLPVQRANIGLSVTGALGERSHALYSFQ